MLLHYLAKMLTILLLHNTKWTKCKKTDGVYCVVYNVWVINNSKKPSFDTIWSQHSERCPKCPLPAPTHADRQLTNCLAIMAWSNLTHSGTVDVVPNKLSRYPDQWCMSGTSSAIFLYCNIFFRHYNWPDLNLANLKAAVVSLHFVSRGTQWAFHFAR